MIMDSIYTRRSVRHYTNQEVEPEKVECLLRAAMQAPSARDQQAWEFLVVRGKQKLHHLSSFATSFSPIQKANVAIMVMANPKKLSLPRAWEQDLGACTQNILLQATELGLGAFWCGLVATVPEEKWQHIRKAYAIPSHFLLYSVVAVGYPAKEKANYFVDRYDPSCVRYLH